MAIWRWCDRTPAQGKHYLGECGKSAALQFTRAPGTPGSPSISPQGWKRTTSSSSVGPSHSRPTSLHLSLLPRLLIHSLALLRTASALDTVEDAPMETDELLSKMPLELRPREGLFPSSRRYLVGVGLLLCVVLVRALVAPADASSGPRPTSSPTTSRRATTVGTSHSCAFLIDALSVGATLTHRITYLNTSSFAFYLIPVAWRYWRKGGKREDGYARVA